MEIKQLIDKYATEYKLETRIVYGICIQESNLNQYAVKYEPNYKWLYKPEELKPKICSLETEIILQKMSFGIGQIMGAVLRERGYTDWLTKILSDLDSQIKYMCKHLSIYYKKYNNNIDMIASYNAGSPKKENNKYVNQKYIDNVLKYAKTYWLYIIIYHVYWRNNSNNIIKLLVLFFMNFMNEKNIAIGALTIIASIAMFVFQKDSLNIVMIVITGIFALTNPTNKNN